MFEQVVQGREITKGDEGLKRFTINGSSAVLANTYCGTGDTYSVDIYVNGKKTFSTWASGPARLNTDHDTFKSVDLKVFRPWMSRIS
jgi:membrane-bound inhibitor of C-type lysozyme